MGLEGKRIADPVHGTIQLNELEVALLETEPFQRLRGVRQLGLANYVFPAADYSRFSHSIGVCHVTRRLLEKLRSQDSGLTEQECRTYQAAALLHDIGHYPFSHTFEHALKGVEGASQIVEVGKEDEAASEPEPPLLHEEVSKELVTTDTELVAVLENYQIDPEEVCSIFLRQEPPRYANLVSSDLDADRIDYLLRTAHHTGLPHGWVDLDYLLTQVRIDNDFLLCLSPKAARTAEHLLLGRYFDYQQVAYHKTVAGLESILQDVIRELLSRNVISGSRTEIIELIQRGEWKTFDDVKLMDAIRSLVNYPDLDEAVGEKCTSLLKRNPPKVLATFERLGQRSESTLQDMSRGWQAAAHKVMKQLAQDFSLPPDLFWVWNPAPGGLVLTKVGAHVPVSALVEEEAEDWDKYHQSVRIERSDGGSRPLSEDPSSILSVLSNHALFISRIYVLIPQDRMGERRDIEARCQELMEEAGW